MPEFLKNNSEKEFNYHNKKLNNEERELLEQQGLYADVRNQLGGITGLISVCELMESNDPKKQEIAQKMFSEAIAQSRKSVAHILAAQTHVEQEKDPEKILLLLKGDRK